MKTGNIFDGVPDRLAGEQFTDLLVAGALRITRIVSTGQTTDWQNPQEEEWVIVLQGAGVLEFSGGRKHQMKPGGWCHIPAGTRHRVAKTDPDMPTIWLAVHF